MASEYNSRDTTAEIAPKLLPCPHCGGRAFLRLSLNTNEFRALCSVCGASTRAFQVHPSDCIGIIGGIANAWNRRVKDGGRS